MKMFLISVLALSLNAVAMDPASYVKNSDQKIYSLKTKGVTDLVVDFESTRLTKQVKDQPLLGKVKDVYFRVYWTANPERVDIEIFGLPEGFREIKDELRLAAFSLIDGLLPPSTVLRFGGYKLSQGTKPKEITAQDTTGLALVPSYVLRFDSLDRLAEIEGNKHIGTYVSKIEYGKDNFASGKWVVNSTTTTNSENGQTLVMKKIQSYGDVQGIGVLTQVRITTDQTPNDGKGRTISAEDVVTFKDYRINKGDALKHFLAQ